ncbi:pol [Symbiodinium sp. CCMP2592]|nr:pol [Symbiodinium sp. CCMP2592]
MDCWFAVEVAALCLQSKQARDTLLCAARDGSLASALQEAREDRQRCKPSERGQMRESEPSKPDVELLRQEARDTLLRAAGDGRLAAAFRSVREASKVAQEAKKAQKGEDLEKLRHEAAQALVAAAQNGKLAEALSSRKPEVDLEALRLEARSTMIRAAQDGSLREALQEARVDTLRAEARDRLLTAARDGRLAAALQRKPAVSEDRASLEEIREKAKSALLKTLDTGDFQKAMESIRQKRETKAPAIVESRPFHLCPSVGTWLLPPQFQVQAPAQPQPVEQAVEEQQVCAAAVPDRPASPTRAMGRTKRRIIGAVVRVPTESLPVDPQPPATSPKSNRPWVMAGAPAAGLRTKEPLAFQMDDDSSSEGQSGGLVRKSSITAMFEAMGSTQLYRMDTLEDDKAPSRPSSSIKLATPGMFKSASAGSVSAMALDMGLPATPLSMDVSSKKERLGTPGMGSRCSSVGALRSLRASKSVKQGGMLPFLNKPNSAIDWSVSHVQSVMCATKSCSFNVVHMHFPDMPVGGRDRNWLCTERTLLLCA